jgi:hypothetical protein
MSRVAELVEEKNSNVQQLQDVLSKYLTRYIENDLAPDSNDKRALRSFQKRLVKVTEWTSQKQDEEYGRFLRWSDKRYHLSESDLTEIFGSIFYNTVKIMFSSYSDTDGELFSDILEDVCSMRTVFLKSLKRVARFYYDNPQLYFEHPNLKTIIYNVIHNCLPMARMIALLEEMQALESKQHHYDFNKTIESSSQHLSQPLVVEKQPKSSDSYQNPKLKYVPSDEFYNEYYNSDDDKPQQSEDEEKHIRVPKLKRYR